MEEDSIDR